MITDNCIKMCEKAEEIQKICEFKKGDWFKIYNCLDETFSLTVLSGDGYTLAEGVFSNPYIKKKILEGV